MNFSTRIILSPDGKWGSKNKDGSWNGMVRDLHENRTQVGLTGLYITKSRSEVVLFSPAFAVGSDRMFIKYPEREKSWTTFVQPFQPILWLALLSLLFIFATSLFMIYKFGNKKTYQSWVFYIF